MTEPIVVLITGGAGFLGQRLVQEIRSLAAERGRKVSIRVLDLAESKHADESIRGNITDAGVVRRACEGADVVIHSAALVDFGSASRARLLEVNVGGSENVLRCARDAGVRAVLYTSTMDVVMGGRPLVAIDETEPYPTSHMDAYAESKARAERAVLSAHSPELITCVLRPCGMFGEADPYHMDNVLRAAREGKLSFRLGSAETVFEHVYVGNVAWAHALALFELLEPSPRIAGRCYFVTDRPAANFFDFMQPFVEHRGHVMPTRSIPTGVAKLLGTLVEHFCKLVSPIWPLRPVLTRSSVSVLVNSISIESDALARDLGYRPRYDEQESERRVMAWYDVHEP